MYFFKKKGASPKKIIKIVLYGYLFAFNAHATATNQQKNQGKSTQQQKKTIYLRIVVSGIAVLGVGGLVHFFRNSSSEVSTERSSEHFPPPSSQKEEEVFVTLSMVQKMYEENQSCLCMRSEADEFGFIENNVHSWYEKIENSTLTEKEELLKEAKKIYQDTRCISFQEFNAALQEMAKKLCIEILRPSKKDQPDSDYPYHYRIINFMVLFGIKASPTWMLLLLFPYVKEALKKIDEAGGKVMFLNQDVYEGHYFPSKEAIQRSVQGQDSMNILLDDILYTIDNIDTNLRPIGGTWFVAIPFVFTQAIEGLNKAKNYQVVSLHEEKNQLASTDDLQYQWGFDFERREPTLVAFEHKSLGNKYTLQSVLFYGIADTFDTKGELDEAVFFPLISSNTTDSSTFAYTPEEQSNIKNALYRQKELRRDGRNWKEKALKQQSEEGTDLKVSLRNNPYFTRGTNYPVLYPTSSDHHTKRIPIYYEYIPYTYYGESVGCKDNYLFECICSLELERRLIELPQSYR